MPRCLIKVAVTVIVYLAMLGGEALSDEPIPEMDSPGVGLPAPAKLKPGKLHRDSSGNIILEPKRTDAGQVLSGDAAPGDPAHADTVGSTESDRAKPAIDQKVRSSAEINIETRPPGNAILQPNTLEARSTEPSQSSVLNRSPDAVDSRIPDQQQTVPTDRDQNAVELESFAQEDALPKPSILKSGDLQRRPEGELVLEPHVARNLRVCTPQSGRNDCHFLELSAALARANPGDTIILSPGIYKQAALVTVSGISIRGEPGAHLKGRAIEGKAALVIRADDVVIDGIECSQIQVRDRNGACIRIEGRNLTIRNVYFHDNQEGVLGGVGGYVIVEDSVFERNGFNTGYAHGLYIGPNVELFSFRRNKVLSTKDEGQGVKSRAINTVIEDNIIASLDSRDSRAIDIPNGGEVIIRRNVLQKGPNSSNSQMIGLGLEGNLHESNSAVIADNVIIFDQDRPAWIDTLNEIVQIAPPRGTVVYSKIDGQVLLTGNIIVGAREIAIGGEAKATDNRMFSSRSRASLPDYPELPSSFAEVSQN